VAHSLYTPTQAARSTIAALRYLTVLPRTVRQDFSQEFVAGRGRTVDIKLPIGVGAARNYTDTNRTNRDAIVFDDLTETTTPVTMDTQVYKAVRLPDDFVTFTLESMEDEVLKPMAESVVDGVTAPLLAKFNGLTNAPTTGTDSVPALLADGSNALQVLIKLRAILNKRKIPFTDRFLALSPAAEAAFLSLAQLQKVNESGTDGVLREAELGRLFGFNILVDPGLTKSVAYHRDAFAHVMRPSAAPRGAAFSTAIAQDGFALRYIQHYNPLQLEDQAVVDTFVGSKVLDANRAVSIADPA
jgi:hypothetical protein